MKIGDDGNWIEMNGYPQIRSGNAKRVGKQINNVPLAKNGGDSIPVQSGHLHRKGKSDGHNIRETQKIAWLNMKVTD